MTQSAQDVAATVRRAEQMFENAMREHAAAQAAAEANFASNMARIKQSAADAHAHLRTLSSHPNDLRTARVLKGGAIVAGVALASAGIYALAHHKQNTNDTNWANRVDAERQNQANLTR